MIQWCVLNSNAELNEMTFSVNLLQAKVIEMLTSTFIQPCISSMNLCMIGYQFVLSWLPW